MNRREFISRSAAGAIPVLLARRGLDLTRDPAELSVSDGTNGRLVPLTYTGYSPGGKCLLEVVISDYVYPAFVLEVPDKIRRQRRRIGLAGLRLAVLQICYC